MPSRRNHADFVAAQLQSPNATSALAASWRRSMLRHGLDPSDLPVTERLSGSELMTRRHAMERFLHVAAPQLDRLFSAVCPAGCNVMLTDADGIVLEQRVREGDATQFREWGLWQGADWSEARQGTNGIGTCLVEGRPVTIHRDQHFGARNTDMSCLDAPIWGPDGRLLAALDVSSARADQTETFNALIAAQVVQTARQIELAWFRAAFPGARIIIAGEDRPDSTAVVAVDRDDIAIGASRDARRQLGLAREGSFEPRPVSDLLGREDESTGFERAERAAVARALSRARGNVSAAARALGVGRATLYRRMKRLGIEQGAANLSHD